MSLIASSAKLSVLRMIMLVFKMNSIEDDSKDVILSGRYDKPFIKEEQHGLFIVDRLWKISFPYSFLDPYHGPRSNDAYSIAAERDCGSLTTKNKKMGHDNVYMGIYGDLQ
jgi:hypothetical protein